MRLAQAHRAPLVVLSSLLLAAGCLDAYPDEADAEVGDVESALTLDEGFEAGTKTAYAVADIVLGSGTWRLDEALIGTSTADAKNGARSARVRTSGRITMRFDRTTGAGTVTVRHARYGSDVSGSWGLFSSQDGGVSWIQVGSTVSTTTTTLAIATFTVNVSGAIRFEVRKLDGGSNRINIDDISITDYGTGGGGGGGGSGASVSIHTTLGLPTPASTTDFNDYLSVKQGYVISYNGSRKVPNWVSWELNTSYLGSTPRQDNFRVDNTLPSGMPQATLADYSGSGFSRGHMCPSGDRTKTVSANSETFYLSNMVPQSFNNNSGPWAQLEDYSRSLAQQGKQLFIVSGGTYSSSSISIGAGVRVPDQTYKVIVVLDAPGQGVSSVTSSTRVIGILMPNRDSQIGTSTPWRNFRVSVDTIEAQTGYDFLSDVDPTVEATVESRIDNL